jgi:hypothetical protein
MSEKPKINIPAESHDFVRKQLEDAKDALSIPTLRKALMEQDGAFEEVSGRINKLQKLQSEIAEHINGNIHFVIGDGMHDFGEALRSLLHSNNVSNSNVESHVSQNLHMWAAYKHWFERVKLAIPVE